MLAFNISNGKNLRGVFWTVKCLLVSGVSLHEINQARDPGIPRSRNPSKMKDPFEGEDPSNRKAKRK